MYTGYRFVRIFTFLFVENTVRKNIIFFLFVSFSVSSMSVTALTTRQKLAAKTIFGLALTALGAGGYKYFDEHDPRLEFLDAVLDFFQDGTEGQFPLIDFMGHWGQKGIGFAEGDKVVSCDFQMDNSSDFDAHLFFKDRDGKTLFDLRGKGNDKHVIVGQKQDAYDFLQRCRGQIAGEEGTWVNSEQAVAVAIGVVGAFIAFKNGLAWYRDWKSSKKEKLAAAIQQEPEADEPNEVEEDSQDEIAGELS